MGNYALEIIQPRPLGELTNPEQNRFYRAYPGLEYNVKVAVIGGDYPFLFSLDAGPAGMTIDSFTGVISWANPVTSGSPHTVTARVRDLGAAGGGEGTGGTELTVTWEITVETSNFLFIDAIAGNDGNSGSIASPLRTLVPIQNAGLTGYFVYFKNGVYSTSEPGLTISSAGALTFAEFATPDVFLAFPGHSPVFEFPAHTLYFPSATHVYADGLTLQNFGHIFSRGFQIGGGDHQTMRRITINGPTPEAGLGDNPGQIFFPARSPGSYSNYLSVTENNWLDLTAFGISLLPETVDKSLIADNIGSGLTDNGRFVFWKKNCRNQHFRNNLLNAIHSGVEMCTPQGGGEGGPFDGDYEISYNRLIVEGGIQGDCIHTGQALLQHGVHYYRRNTFVGQVVMHNIRQLNQGPHHFSNNVIVNTVIQGGVTPDHYTYVFVTEPGQITTTGDLKGFPADGIIDANGDLQGAYRDQYLGLKGYELSGADVTAPAAPTGLVVS